ncbi:MAG: S8 family serine peptidase [Bacteroidaceae bacterium]|nr:S8 family serine peptidase [Bacteroidaceae bacterium]
MKKILLIALCLFVVFSVEAHTLIRQEGRVCIEQSDELWDVDTTKIIVHIETTAAYPADLKVNKLGFTTIPVPDNVRIETFMDSLQRLPFVRLAEYNVCGKPTAFNDPYYSSQWYYTSYNFDQLVSGVPACYRKIVIAVIDTGLDIDHPDLGIDVSNNQYGALYVNDGEIPDNNVDDDGDGYVDNYLGWDFYNNRNYFDEVAIHGTGVLGLIGAKTNNYKGISGFIGGRDDIKLMPLCVGINSFQATIVAEAITYAADHGANIINMSFTVAANSTINTAIAYAKSKGVLMVAAAGNNSNGTKFPANDNRVMGVSSVNSSNLLSSFSNKGSLDVAAPGEGIYVLDRNNGAYIYSSLNGTSYSAPMVSTLAAYVMAKNPFITAKDVRSIIDTTAVNNSGYTTNLSSYDWDNWSYDNMKPYSDELGFGTIQPLAAIAAAERKLPQFYVDDRYEGNFYVCVKLKIENFYNSICNELNLEDHPEAKYTLSIDIDSVASIPYHSPSVYYVDDGDDFFDCYFEKIPNYTVLFGFHVTGIVRNLDGVEIYRFGKYIPVNVQPNYSLSLGNGLVSDAIVLNNETCDMSDETSAIASVYSLGNQVVEQQTVDLTQPKIIIDISSLQRGHYFVELHSKGTNIFNGHVIKTR